MYAMTKEFLMRLLFDLVETSSKLQDKKFGYLTTCVGLTQKVMDAIPSTLKIKKKLKTK